MEAVHDPMPDAAAADKPESSGQAPPPLDNSIVIHPHLFEPSPKPSAAVQFSKQLLRHVGSSGDKARAKEYAAQLDQTRKTLQAALDSTTVAEDSVHTALAEYVSVLMGLIEAPGKAEAAAGSPQGVKADSPLRRAVSFQWQTSIVGSGMASCADAVFELANVLVATGIWLMQRAAQLCRDSASGVASAASMQANKLLRQAAGLLEYVQAWLLPLLPAGMSEDCSPQILKGLSLLCLADCQSLTLLRAIQKGNQPALIAGIARDTAALYGSALQSMLSSTLPAVAGSKVAHYLRYKQASLSAYAHCFAGIAQWKGEQTGAALRWLQEGQAQAEAAKKSYQDYDKAPPATLTNTHRRYDEVLQAVLVDTRQRVQKENDAVYLQKMPQALPEPPAAKRLVAPTPYALPLPAPAVREGMQRCFTAAPALAAEAIAVQGPPSASAKPADASRGTAADATAQHAEQDKVAQEGCVCTSLRWLLFIIAMPLYLLISAVGIVLWIVLLPFKIVCCPCGCLVQLIANVMEYMIKAPLRLMLWVSKAPKEQTKNPPV